MGSLNKRLGPITSPVIRDKILEKGPITSPVIKTPVSEPGTPRLYPGGPPIQNPGKSPNPGKFKRPLPVPREPWLKPVMPEDPRVSQPVEGQRLPGTEEENIRYFPSTTAPSEAQTLAATVGAQVVPSAVTQETKKGPKRRKPTTGTLGSAGSLL